MDEIRQYILSVVCVATICGIIQLSFSSKNSTSRTVKLITGLVLTITIMRPIMHIDALDPEAFLGSVSTDGQWAVAEGERTANDQLAACIKEDAESYILDKANEWGLEVQAEVVLSAATPPIPESVTITGTVSPYGKKKMAHCIEDNLGIAEENQLWILGSGKQE